ncbi:uncharacterized protein LOC125652381 [Ostrea edulis]|uniref:uncharacterized protein LOC125652381 n=1 Tax=Ostrea edulis TaxID=37623 RepID=UPI0024AF4BA1|nr:uncharacterized protein LOC125652381 [Ostrea edulis]
MANAQVRVDFLENGRGGFFLLYGGFKYSVRNRYNDRTYWRCVDRQCPATLTTTNNIIVSFGRHHNHDDNYVGLAAESFISGVKKRCRDEATAIPTIYDDELGGLRNAECDDSVVDMIRQIPTFQASKSALYRARAKTTPKLPTSQDDIKLHGPWINTLAGERFLLCDDTDAQGHRIMIFATDTNINHLCAAEVIFSDGTFYSCTRFFTQLYTLHGNVNGTIFPLIYGLLPNKSEDTYNRFFSLLKDSARRLQSVSTPESWLLDFEIVARNAVHHNFPGASIKG